MLQSPMMLMMLFGAGMLLVTPYLLVCASCFFFFYELPDAVIEKYGSRVIGGVQGATGQNGQGTECYGNRRSQDRVRGYARQDRICK